MVNSVDPELLVKRRLAWDILPCGMTPGFMKNLGLLPGSDGGDDLEHHQSHQRLNRIAGIQDTVKAYSELAGEVAAKAILRDLDYGFEDNDNPRLKHYQDTIKACVQAVVANLIDTEVIHLTEDQ